MAFVVKNSRPRSTSSANAGMAILEQFIHIVRPALVLPQSTTEQLFRVYGGRVLVKAMVGTVTTVLTATDPTAKISSKALDTASAGIGTAVDIASTVNAASLEVGGTLFVEGDGTALVKANAGATFIGTNTGLWIAPAGEIYLTTGANNTTGVMKWDIWYQPLDEAAYVVPVATATAAI